MIERLPYNGGPNGTPGDNSHMQEREQEHRQEENRRAYDGQKESDIYHIDSHQAQSTSEDRPGPRLTTENNGLAATNLGKHFKKRPILRSISLSVKRGEVVGLLGPNGAGKTTAFYIITGLISSEYGTISLDGEDITSLPMYRRSRLGIGYLPQEASIFRGLSVENNIRAILEVVEPNHSKREAQLDFLLAEFSITHLRRTPALALSGGERRRVEIARCLASSPKIILLDEPLAGIDPIAVGEIRDLVLHLKDRGIGVLITDHNVRETLDVVDRAYILHDGVVLMEGKPSEIVTHQEVRRVYLGDNFSL
jgi:lipopolysaccharide export system ATP-binding protein